MRPDKLDLRLEAARQRLEGLIRDSSGQTSARTALLSDARTTASSGNRMAGLT
jgi:hypothetical protein